MIRECNMSTRASEDDLMHWKYKYKKKDKNGRWRYYYDVGRNDMYGPTGSKLQGYTKLQDWLGYDERDAVNNYSIQKVSNKAITDTRKAYADHYAKKGRTNTINDQGRIVPENKDETYSGVGRLRINAVNKKFNQAVEAYYKTPIGKIDKLLAKVKKGKTLVDKAKNFINKNWSMVTFYD